MFNILEECVTLEDIIDKLTLCSVDLPDPLLCGHRQRPADSGGISQGDPLTEGNSWTFIIKLINTFGMGIRKLPSKPCNTFICIIFITEC